MEDVCVNHYHLRIQPDLKTHQFTATARIRAQLNQPVDRVRLHALNLEITQCRAHQAEQEITCDVRTDDGNETITIEFPGVISGTIHLSLAYRGTIADSMAGFYRSRFTHAGKTGTIAITQFQESDARRAFPCIDHPAAKATFDIELIVDRHLTAISNMAVDDVIPLDDRRKRVVFHTTPKMSTYLVFFGVGDFTITADTRDPRVRSVTLPGGADLAATGRAFAGEALAYCEDYTGIAYPLDKMDVIAIPDFAFGAMENWGAITFRENLLLYDPEKTSTSGLERICEVIAHEVVHQWFGNLVTPSQWRYLWLNESFATYFGYGIVDRHAPEWQTWHQFLQSQTNGAMRRDSLEPTFAIEIPGGEHVVINSATAPIIYSKGASILRQMEAYIGADHFREGLRRYLNQHAYANTTSHDFWEAFETVSKKPVTGIMRSWVEQPGLPVVTVSRESDGLHLKQQRFTYRRNAHRQCWQIPIMITLFTEDGADHRQTTLLDTSDILLPLEVPAIGYKINSGQTGFYRTCYRDQQNLAFLGEYVAGGKLVPEDRWGLQNDFYELVLAGREAMTDWLDFLAVYRSESHPLPLSGIAENLYEAARIGPSGLKPRIQTLGRHLLSAAVQRFGMSPRDHDPHPVATLRDRMLWHLACYDEPKTVDTVLEWFRDMQSGRDIHPDIMKSTLQVGAQRGDHRVLEWLMDRFAASSNEHERMNLLAALGAFPTPALLEQALDMITERVPDRIRFLTIAAMAENPAAAVPLWDWFRRRQPELEKGHPILFERIITSVIRSAGLYAPDEVDAFFENYRDRMSALKDTIDLALERSKVDRAVNAGIID